MSDDFYKFTAPFIGSILCAIVALLAYFLKRLHDSHDRVCRQSEELSARVAILENTTQKSTDCQCPELRNQVTMLEGRANSEFVKKGALERFEDQIDRRFSSIESMLHESLSQFNMSIQVMRKEFMDGLSELRRAIMGKKDDSQ